MVSFARSSAAYVIKDMQSRQGLLHFRVKGKRGKVRFVPVHVPAQRHSYTGLSLRTPPPPVCYTPILFLA
jgi:hypothetical protein